MAKGLKVKPTDIIRIETSAKKELAERFKVSLPTVNIALRGATRSGNAPFIREAAMNNYPYHIIHS